VCSKNAKRLPVAAGLRREAAKELPLRSVRGVSPASSSNVEARSMLLTNWLRLPTGTSGPTTISGTRVSESYGVPLPPLSWCWPRW